MLQRSVSSACLSPRHEKKSIRVSNRIEILKNRIESKFCGSKFDTESIFKIKNKWYHRTRAKKV